MRSLAAVTTVWNMERFIKAHLSMLEPVVDKIVVVASTRPLEPYRIEHGYSTTPDASLEIIRTHFPKVEIHTYEPEDQDSSMMFANMWNFGMERVSEFDMALKLDCDHFFTPEDLKTFIKAIRTSNYENIALDWSTNSINYYHDLDHGLMDQQEVDPLAINPKMSLGPYLTYPEDLTVIDEPITLHHLRNVNKPWVTPAWLEGKEPSPYGVYSTDLLKEHGTVGGKWFIAPDQIKSMLA